MKVSITAKQVVILFMTMALAVALVACSGAVGKTGETGEPGPAGPPGEPPEPVNLAPIARATAFEPMQLREDGDVGTRNVAANFVDPDEDPLMLTISVSAMPEGAVEAVLADGVLTVTPVAAGTADITVTATDGSKSVSAILKVTVDDAGVPIYRGMLAGATLTYGGQHVIPGTQIESSFEGEALTFSAVGSDDTIVLVSPLADDNTLTITALSKVGKADVTITATDEDGETISHSIEISVVASYQPEAIGSIPSQSLIDDGPTVDVNASIYFSDPAGDDLTYMADSSAPLVATADVAGSIVTITPVGDGDADIFITATNSRSLSAMQKVSVNVTEPVPAMPVVSDDIEDVLFQTPDADAQTIMLSDHFTGATEYSPISSNTAVATAIEAGGVLTVTPMGVGTTEVTVMASNASGTVSDEFVVNVLAADTQNMPPELKPGEMIGPFKRVASGTNAAHQLDLDDYFVDPNGSDALLTYIVTQDKGKETQVTAPDSGPHNVIQVGGGTAPTDCSSIADTAGEDQLPDGTDLIEDTLWICYINPGYSRDQDCRGRLSRGRVQSSHCHGHCGLKYPA